MSDHSKCLEGKVALVTGAAGGIGWGICAELAEHGARVLLTDIDKEGGQEVLREISSTSSGHQFYPLDIRNIGAFPELVEKIWGQHGRIDILVNNAGVNTAHGLLDMTPEAWDTVHDTNLRGHFFLSQAVSKRMVESGVPGVILFITSVHQEIVQQHPHYSTSKAGLAMLIKEMAVELAPSGIRVVGIAPGGIDISGRLTDPQRAGQEETVLLGGRNGIPRDIGRAAVMLASNYWSRYITGEILTVSGGQYLSPKKAKQK
ncbi:SDR family oxidoreductase [Candidatus Parcubacteria bacterium]|nr:SDR family oxidoreductase [Candidatus Parcubacteria bacterium]